MTIMGVVNGMYRSGSSFVFYEIYKRHPDWICLYEPFLPHLHEKLPKTLYFRSDFTIPTWSILRKVDYAIKRFKVPVPRIFEDYTTSHERDYMIMSYGNRTYKEIVLPMIQEDMKRIYRKPIPMPESREEIKPIIDKLHNSKHKFFLQTNRLHFLLEEFTERGIPTFQLIRKPEEIINSMTVKLVRRRPRLRRYWLKDKPLNEKIKYFLEKVKPYFKWEVELFRKNNPKYAHLSWLDLWLLWHKSVVKCKCSGVVKVWYPNYDEVFSAFDVKNYVVKPSKIMW